MAQWIRMFAASPDTIADAKKCYLTGAWYSCPVKALLNLINTDADTHSQPLDRTGTPMEGFNNINEPGPLGPHRD